MRLGRNSCSWQVVGPRVVLSSEPKTGERQVQLIGRGTPAYPTIDITCDGKRWTIPATESTTVATYAVPEDTAETMFKAVGSSCGRGRTWTGPHWSGSPRRPGARLVCGRDRARKTADKKSQIPLCVRIIGSA
jgi:hypothetical protein